MGCTSILVGRRASWDGSTMIARNDDSGAGHFMPKKLVVVKPEMQPRHYKSVISGVEIDLPENPLRYTAMPNAVEGEGIWAAAGINAENTAMTATETITTNSRVLAADPLVKGGIGEEDLVVITLPYIHSAREGVLRLGELHETWGTYESNAVALSDENEIWWFESVGGHHWIAKRVPDDSYVVMPNQLGIDRFDLADAFGEKKEHLCSPDLREFITENHLDLSIPEQEENILNPRLAFGSRDDSDHCYNTPRAWYIQKRFSPRAAKWEGPDADYTPESDDIPWSALPEHLLTPEDVKYALSSHYQGTAFDPYLQYGEKNEAGKYRSVGINRTDFMSIAAIRPDLPADVAAVEWISFASNAFNTMVPLFTNVEKMPAYFSCTTGKVSTESFYWASRLIAALADAAYGTALFEIETYQQTVPARGRKILHDALAEIRSIPDPAGPEIRILLENANEKVAEMTREETDAVLKKVLDAAGNNMKNQYARSDA